MMGRTGCTINGDLDESKFNEPMPWIGIYVAAASAACAVAMAADAVKAFRYGKFWFPCKFFSLNATTLTLIAVAVKFSVDLNTSMPHRQDQLAKVSSSAFICTVISNFMPSIGNMDNNELMMNILALGILVVTSMVNICIQLGTGVIFVFWLEHAFIMLLMLVLLALLISTALAVPTTKNYFDVKYLKKLEVANKESSQQPELPLEKRLRESLRKYWTMAYTCCPQFVIGRSATCTASGAFALLSALTLAEAMLRSYLLPWSFRFCKGTSDYKWSTSLVLITQTVAVGIGSIAPTLRWFTVINFRCVKRASKASKQEFRVEKYWIKKLLEWQEQPLSVRIWGRHRRKYAHSVKSMILECCIRMQKGIVLMSKLARFISIFIVSRFLILKGLIKCENSISSTDTEESDSNFKQDLSRFVMRLEGEEEMVDLLGKKRYNATDHIIRMGKKQQPVNLIQLLEKSSSLREFKGSQEFDSNQVPSLDSVEPPNCWALPIVTLTSIAMALPNIDNSKLKQLVTGVHEALLYVREVENNLDEKEDLINTRNAAEVVWLGVDLYGKWLDVDLRKMALQGETEKEVLEKLVDIAKNVFSEFQQKEILITKGCLLEVPSKWPIKVLAANSMYRICQTILLDYKGRDYACSEKLFEKLSDLISRILRACFTNLHHVISKQCHRSRIEGRLQSIHNAVLLFGRTKNILKIVDRLTVEYAHPGQLAYVDEWNLLSKQLGGSEPSDPCGGDGDMSNLSSFSISVE